MYGFWHHKYADLSLTARVHRLHVCTLLHNQHWPVGRRLRCHAQSLLSFAELLY